jgi:hypothetical protein
MADDRPPDDADLESREPTVEDLRDLCRALNERGARYVVIGGFAIRAAGYNRRTMDVDLLVADDPDNEARVFSALSTLPDNAVRDLQPGELTQYSVIRVADEIIVDLMRLAGGIGYAAAAADHRPLTGLRRAGARPALCRPSAARARSTSTQYGASYPRSARKARPPASTSAASTGCTRLTSASTRSAAAALMPVGIVGCRPSAAVTTDHPFPTRAAGSRYHG